MTQKKSEVIEGFRAALHGALLQPGDAGYDAARGVWNAMIDGRPAPIARCAGTADVMAAVAFARDHGRWLDAADDARCTAWARDFFAAVAPHAAGSVYINFMTQDETVRIREAYGPNWAELGAAAGAQGALRSGQPVPFQSQHSAGCLTCRRLVGTGWPTLRNAACQ